MSSFWLEPSVVWSLVYAGLATFFALGSRKFDRPGYALVGAALGTLSLAGVGVALARAAGTAEVTREWALFGARLLVFAAAFGPAFNTHFLFHFVGRGHERLVPFLGYVFGGAAFLADIAATIQGAPVGTFPLGVTPVLAIFVTFVFVVHLVVDAVVLAGGLKMGRQVALLPLISIVLLGPIAAFSLYNVVVVGRSVMFTQMLTWVYALAIVWGLIAELRGAEGRLHATTSDLAQRTHELQASYAEIELMHDELSKKEQLAAVGELAASIAHEVRNPLAIIINASTGLRRNTLSPTDQGTLLAIIDEEAERLNQLVTELLRFARPVKASRSPASLFDICERVKDSAPEGYQVRVRTPPEEELGAVWVDPGLFRLALDNLMANAVQAMPGGGTITITVEEAKFSDGGQSAAVRVQDTGVGMRPEELERAKKPFFTTKPRGTGLGLAIVERIVDAHGGELTIESELSVGTTVTLKVPVYASEDGPSDGSRPISGGPVHHKSKSPFVGAQPQTTRQRLRSVPPGPPSSQGRRRRSVPQTPHSPSGPAPSAPPPPATAPPDEE